MQASYNQFRSITLFVDAFRSDKDVDEIRNLAISRGNEVAGVSSSARANITSFMREHLRCVPRNEHWDQPIPYTLERVKRKKEER